MALLTIRHDVYFHDDTATVDLLSLILKNQEIIMATNAEIKALAEEIKGDLVTLTDAVNAEQEQIAIAIQKLNDIIAGGGTEAERQEILDILTASKATIAEVVADIKATIPDEENPV